MRKSYRVKKESEFQRVFETHNSVANHKFVIYQMAKPGQKHFRVGISVGKRIGNAVHRNWVKRRIRQTLLSRGQAVLGRQLGATTPWLTKRHGYDPTSFCGLLVTVFWA